MEPREIRERRRALGLSQARLGKLIDADRVTIIRWELGDQNCSHPAMLDLAMCELENRQVLDPASNSG